MMLPNLLAIYKILCDKYGSLHLCGPGPASLSSTSIPSYSCTPVFVFSAFRNLDIKVNAFIMFIVTFEYM